MENNIENRNENEIHACIGIRRMPILCAVKADFGSLRFYRRHLRTREGRRL